MVIDKTKLLNRFLEGAVTTAGTVLVRESYKMYKTIDPLRNVRVRNFGESKRKKLFDDIMAQTNLKMEQA